MFDRVRRILNEALALPQSLVLETGRGIEAPGSELHLIGYLDPDCQRLYALRVRKDQELAGALAIRNEQVAGIAGTPDNVDDLIIEIREDLFCLIGLIGASCEITFGDSVDDTGEVPPPRYDFGPNFGFYSTAPPLEDLPDTLREGVVPSVLQ